MFGDYAKALQNEGTTFDAWLAFKGNWHHIWRDAATGDVSEGSRTDKASNLGIPEDLINMTRTNTAIMKGIVIVDWAPYAIPTS